MNKQCQAIRGFRDLYPADKAIQNYIFDKLKKTADLFGFQHYDGPIVEPIEIYLGKTSRELIDEQTFQITDKKGETLVMRPEMTPSLARMVAAKEQQLTFPLRLFNLGLRFRYEAPQKGREREFYQADFDILGSDSILADAEILNTAVFIFLSFGATVKDFIISINSRSFMQEKLKTMGIADNEIKKVISIIDKKNKMSTEKFSELLNALHLGTETIKQLIRFVNQPIEEKNSYFDTLFDLLKDFQIDQYVKVNPAIVRGLDYYTGLVFEAKEKGDMTRSLLGGGRYDNLVETFGASRKIPGVGFATSDVILWEFLKDKNLIPELKTKSTKVLVTVFPDGNSVGNRHGCSLQKSIEIVNFLRHNNIPSELYPETDKKLDKQLKYADRNKIPYAIIIGPEEIEKNVVKLKNLQTGEQKLVSEKELLSNLSSLE